MLPVGLNHMTVPGCRALELLDIAGQLGCAGVEFRNDLGRPLFDGEAPELIRDMANSKGLRILALAEVKAFNDTLRDRTEDALDLMRLAVACGAEGVALIPKVCAGRVDRADQRNALKDALGQLQPMLEDHGLLGLIEPLGFKNSSLRYKDDVIDVLNDLGRPTCFSIIHDTFHHHLAGGDRICAELTGLVHVSGVSDPAPATGQMTDLHRVLVDESDRLGNIVQLRELADAGYEGVASFEAFAPEIHQLTHPAEALAGSMTFIASHLVGEPA